MNAFHQRPGQEFRVRDLHELLGMPTYGPSLHVTRSSLGCLTRQGFPTRPGGGFYQRGT